jgi:hypothetical protein
MQRLSFVFAIFLAACVIPPPENPQQQQQQQPAPAPAAPPVPVQPVGTWSTTWTWGTGTCGLMGSTNNSVGVTQSAMGYMLNESTPGAAVNGSINCDTASCKMLASENTTVNGGPANVSVNFTLAPNGAINGTGSVSLTSPSCSQTFTAMGRRV